MTLKFCKAFLFILLTSLSSCAAPAVLPGATIAPVSTPSPVIQPNIVETPTGTRPTTQEPAFMSPPVVSSPTASATQLPSNLKVWAEDLRREGNTVKAAVCFELPDDNDWMIDQAVLHYEGGEASHTSAERLESRPPSADGAEDYRCEEISFPVPLQADLASTTLIINKLIAYPNEGEYCDKYLNEVQPTLTARQTGIVLECTQVDHGNNLSILSKPDALSLEDAQRVVYGFYTVQGSWTFSFKNPPSFVFDPLPYQVKAKAMNFRLEGEVVKVDVCFQMDNTDWEAWQVVEGILQYAGQEDRFFGTSAQLRRTSPPNARIRQYCGTLEGFPNFTSLPATAKPSDFSLTITSLAPVVDSSNVCTTYLQRVQERLDEKRMGIQLQCGKTAQGDYALRAVSLHEGFALSPAAVEHLMKNIELFLSLQGPWKFTFD